MQTLPELTEFLCIQSGADQDQHSCQIAEAAIKHATRYGAAKKPDRKSEVSRRRMKRRTGRVANDELVGFGILGFVVGEFVSWWIGKILDAWWAWYWGEPRAEQLCGAMVQSANLPAWSSAEDAD